MPLFLIAGAALGLFWWLKSRVPAATTARAPVPVTNAASLNTVLLGGTAAQKQLGVMAYEKLKGLPVTGIYTVAIQHLMTEDGVANPAPLPASITED